MTIFRIGKSFFNGIYRRLGSAAIVIILLTIMLAVFAAIHKGSYIIINAIVSGGMWALMAMGLSMIFGVMNIPNFAHGEYFMIGGLVAFCVVTPLKHHIINYPSPILEAVTPLIAMFTAAVAGMVAGVFSEFLVFRPLRRRNREQWVMNTFVLTLGISVVLINSHQLIFGTTFKGIVRYWNYPSVSIFGTFCSFDRIAIFIVAVLTLIGFWVFMTFSRIGRAIRAVSQDEAGAMMVGINLNVIQTLTLALSCGFAALAGAGLLFMYPCYPNVGAAPNFYSWFAVVVAGVGNVTGAVMGAFFVSLFQDLTTVYVGEGWEYVIPLALITLILVYKPTGIFGSEVRGILEQ